MTRPNLSLTRLEPREVPAAGLFADIRPGVWGSNPQMHAASGDTLYFSANDIYHGTELWATDGTPAGTHMVKDLNPGKPGSGIYGIPAGGGVFYFVQQNELSRQQVDYKTDGTEAGTVQIANGYATISATGGFVLGGWKGDLYYLTATQTAGVWQLRRTNGTSESIVTNFNGQQLQAEGWTTPNRPLLPDGYTVRESADRITFSVVNAAGQKQVWQSDGTPAGTVMQQSNLTASSPTTGPVTLSTGVKLGSGQYLFRSMPNAAGTSSIWTGDGTGTARTFLRRFEGSLQNISYGLLPENTATVNGKAVFMVVPKEWNDHPPADTGIWVSDGTPAGTKRLDIQVYGERYPVVRGTFDGKALVQVPTGKSYKWEWVLTDGTDAGTTPVPVPDGLDGLVWYLAGIAPADAADPKGFLLFGTAEGAVYRTDGTATGTVGVSLEGLRPSNDSWPVSMPGNGWVSLSGGADSGLYFHGSVYYPFTTGDRRYGTELWKWEVAPAGPVTPPTTPPPAVTGTQVNDGAAQRSMVKTIRVTFDAAVNIDLAGVTITGSGGGTAGFTGTTATANGKTTLTLTFPNSVGGSIADGRWTLKIAAGKVTAASGGKAMAADYMFRFTRVFGDLSGDGRYDRETRTLARQLQGVRAGDVRFNAALDVNGDGLIDAADELAAVRNWGKAV